MMQRVLNIPAADMPKHLDATDGLAAAMCHYYQGAKPQTGAKSYTGWKAFLQDNPSRMGKKS
jgi:crossover junction endodeoxyribonuclease RuvC